MRGPRSSRLTLDVEEVVAAGDNNFNIKVTAVYTEAGRPEPVDFQFFVSGDPAGYVSGADRATEILTVTTTADTVAVEVVCENSRGQIFRQRKQVQLPKKKTRRPHLIKTVSEVRTQTGFLFLFQVLDENKSLIPGQTVQISDQNRAIETTTNNEGVVSYALSWSDEGEKERIFTVSSGTVSIWKNVFRD